MRSRQERRQIDRILNNVGLPGLENPSGMFEALAKRIDGHEHLRNCLLKCEPAERVHMYEALRPHLRFQPKSLDIYISEAARIAEAKQLPSLVDGKFVEYRTVQFRTLYSTVVKIPLTAERLLQSMRNLLRDIPDDNREEVIFKAHVVIAKITGDEFLRISAGLYIGTEAQRIQ